ncbi:hypothetical protein AURDEDRAFT_167442 [Auricularia subglabra TFB-10046 SS5]|nr:hypothetical protein AURDEDRAFT_167442 [Auricularia subglabra TFB-10046 SS5]
MFMVSTAFWAASVAKFLFRIKAHFIFPSLVLKNSPNVAFLNAAMLVNYVIADAVVVSRAWTLCREESPHLVYVPWPPALADNNAYRLLSGTMG